MRHKLTLILGIALSASIASSQQMGLSGPIEGFVFDAPTGSFRAVLGFPGSASLGPALLQGFSYGLVAPHKNYGIALHDGHASFVTGFGAGAASAHAITGAQQGAEEVTWSGDGSLAIIYSRSAGWLQYLTGFPAPNQINCGGGKAAVRPCLPSASEPVDVSSIGGTLSAIAIDFQGMRVALGTSGTRGGVLLATNRQGFVPALDLSDPIAMAFSDDASTLYALDGKTHQLHGLSVTNLSSQTYSLDGLKNPFAVKSGRDASGRSVIYIASGKDRIFRTYDPVAHQILSDLALKFVPLGIEDLGHASFLLAPRKKNSDALWLFTSAPHRGVYFVPALAGGGSSQ